MYLTLNQKIEPKQQYCNNKTIKVDDKPVLKYTVQLIVVFLSQRSRSEFKETIARNSQQP